MKPLLAALLALLLASCAAIDPGRPPLKTVQANELGLQNSPIRWPDEKWWTRYQDTQLDQLIVDALLNNPGLDAAQARLRAANASVAGARAIQLPQLNASYAQTRERFSENYIYPPPYAGSMQTDASLRLDLGFDLDLWGKSRYRYTAALSRAHAQQAETQVARNALISGLTQSYFNLQSALAQQSVVEKIVRQLQDVSNITRQRVAAGLDTKVEINQADSAVSSAKVQLSQIQTNAELLRHQLAALAGAGPQRGTTIQRTSLADAPAGVPKEIPLDLLGRRPDIVAAKLRVQASASDISAAKAEFFPNINLSAFAGFMSLGLDNLLSSSSVVYGVGPAITLPVFHGGALNAQLRGRQAARDLAIADYNQAVLSAIREVADAATAIRALQQQTIDQHAGYQAISAAYDIAVKRYRSGLGNFVQVLLAQNEVQKQAILDTELRARAYNLDAQLASALGGGYQSIRHEPQSTR